MTDTSQAPRDESSALEHGSMCGRRFAAFMLVLAVLYAAGVNSHWRFQRDSARYMTLARSLAETGTYSLNYRAHTFAFPGFPAMLSVIYYMTAGESFLAMNVLVSLFGIGSVAVAYMLFRELSLSRRQMTACLLLFGLSRTLYYYSTHVMADVPFTFFVLVGLYCGVKMLSTEGRAMWLWCVAATGAVCAATSLRPLGLALVIGLITALALGGWQPKRWGVRLGRMAVLSLPLAVLGAAWATRSATVSDALSRNYTDIFLRGRGVQGVCEHVLRGAPMVVGSLSDTLLGKGLRLPVNLLLAFLAGVGLVAAVRRGERLLCAYGVVYLGAICLSSPNRRYLMPALPVLLWWIVLGAGCVGDYVAERRKIISPRRALQVGTVLLALALAVNLLRIADVIRQARSPRFYEVTEDGRLPDYFELVEWLRDNAGRADCVLAYEKYMLHYFSRVPTTRGHIATRFFRLRREIDDLKKQGVTYVVRDRDKEEVAARIDQLLEARPRAFEQVRTFGMLDLFRVHPEWLEDEPRPGGGKGGAP